jgi:hypothetical protein
MLLLQLISLLRPDSHRHRRPYVNIHDRREKAPKDNADTVAEDRIRDDIAEHTLISTQRITAALLHGRSCVRCLCVLNAQQRMQDLLPTRLPGSSVLLPGAPAISGRQLPRPVAHSQIIRHELPQSTFVD